MTTSSLFTLEVFLKTLLFLKLLCRSCREQWIVNHGWILFRHSFSILKRSCNSILDCCHSCIVFSNFIGTSLNLNVPSSSFTLSKNCLTVWSWLKSFFLMQSICHSVGEEKWSNLIYTFQLRGVDIILAGARTSADKHSRLVFKPFFTFDNNLRI